MCYSIAMEIMIINFLIVPPQPLSLQCSKIWKFTEEISLNITWIVPQQVAFTSAIKKFEVMIYTALDFKERTFDMMVSINSFTCVHNELLS